MLRLSAKEANRLIDIGRSQNVIPQGYNIGSSEMFAFTEEGVAMLSGVLRSKAAVQVISPLCGLSWQCATTSQPQRR